MTTEELVNKVALVTGGNRGLGRAIVEASIAAGAGVVFTYRSHADEARGVVESVEAAGGKAVAMRLDVTDPTAFSTFALDLSEVLHATWGREGLDVLVNNAGFSGATVLGSTDETVVDQLFAVHFKGIYLLTQCIAAPPSARRYWRMVGGSSIYRPGLRVSSLRPTRSMHR